MSSADARWIASSDLRTGGRRRRARPTTSGEMGCSATPDNAASAWTVATEKADSARAWSARVTSIQASEDETTVSRLAKYPSNAATNAFDSASIATRLINALLST